MCFVSHAVGGCHEDEWEECFVTGGSPLVTRARFSEDGVGGSFERGRKQSGMA
jgi:hypothetical protein